MKKTIQLVLMMGLLTVLQAQPSVVPLYTSTVPGSESWTWKEKETNKNPLNTRIVYNVSSPTLTIYLPEPGVANGAGVIVCPGGGFHVLLFDKEGTAVANELTKKGLTVFVLKYRLVQSITDDPWQEMMGKMKDMNRFRETVESVKRLALEDAFAALKYVRQHADEYKLDPNKIGIMGFSAGGALSSEVAFNYKEHTRPDFLGIIYMGLSNMNNKVLPADAPPLFIAGATDDQLVPVNSIVSLYSAWVKEKHPAELHLYSNGGHGLNGFPASSWINRFTDWLEVQGMIKKDK